MVKVSLSHQFRLLDLSQIRFMIHKTTFEKRYIKSFFLKILPGLDLITAKVALRL